MGDRSHVTRSGYRCQEIQLASKCPFVSENMTCWHLLKVAVHFTTRNKVCICVLKYNIYALIKMCCSIDLYHAATILVMSPVCNNINRCYYWWYKKGTRLFALPASVWLHWFEWEKNKMAVPWSRCIDPIGDRSHVTRSGYRCQEIQLASKFPFVS